MSDISIGKTYYNQAIQYEKEKNIEKAIEYHKLASQNNYILSYKHLQYLDFKNFIKYENEYNKTNITYRMFENK